MIHLTSFRRTGLLAVATLLAAAPLSFAATYQWDVNGTTAGLGGAGTWDTTTADWDLVGTGLDDGTDPTTTYTFTNADTALFGGTAGSVTLSGAVTLNALSFTTDGYTLSGSTVTLAGTTPTITTAANVTAIISSALAGSTAWSKGGAGTLTLTGANTMTGAVTVNAGTLVIGASSTIYGGGYLDAANMLVVNSGGTVVFNGWGYGVSGGFGNLDDHNQDRQVNGGTLVYAGVGLSTVSSTSAERSDWIIGASGATLDAENTTGYWGWGTKSGQFNAGYDDLSLNGTVTFTGAGNGDMQKQLIGSGSLVKDGAGTWVIGYSQTNAGTHDATYSGGTTIKNGTLQIRATGLGAALPTTGNVQIDAPGILDLNTRGVTIAGLSGAGTVTSSAGGALTFTVGNNNATSAFSGVIQNGAGAVALTKTGTGTLTLSGNNTYTGGTTVSAGVLTVDSGGSIKVGATGVTVTGGATLAVNGTLSLTDAGASISNSGTVAFAASGSSIFAGTQFDGLGSGSYQLISGGTVTNAGNVFVDLTGSKVWQSAVLGSNGTLTFTAVPEPSTYGLAGVGVLAAVSAVRRRRRAKFVG